VTRRVLWLGALLVLAAEFMFASVGAVVRHLSADLSNPMLVFFRNLFGLLFLLPLLLRPGRLSLRTRVPGLHLLRGLAGLSAMYCFFYAIAHMPLANAMLLKLSAPLFIPLVALLWLGEHVGMRTLLAVGIGFVGVAITIAPQLGPLAPVAAVAMLGGLFAAIAKVCLRKLSATEPATRTVFYFAALGSAVSALPLPWLWVSPGPAHWFWLFAIGGLASVGQLLLTRGFGLAGAGELGVFGYFSVVFAAIWGWHLWQEPVTLHTVIGSLLVMAAGLLSGARQIRRQKTNRFVKQHTENVSP
jgi:drug/metabolite transporter (DMT)-like permease